MFELIRSLYGVDFVAVDGIETWHPDVRYYALTRDGEAFAGLYMDLFARDGKQGGAWMDVCRPRLVDGDSVQLPIAYLNCNFAPPSGDRVPTMEHGDLITLLHEMGHCLHHLLNRIDLPSISGTTGFEWDAVELPSQLMENFGWDRAILKSMSSNVDSGLPLPDDLVDRMIGARRFQSGLALLRQIEIALFDMELHLAAAGADEGTAMRILQAVRDEVSITPSYPWGRFPHSFTHVFAGGYAAGYYSYLWAERLAADAFEKFAGGEPSVIGAEFRDEILAVGSTRPVIDSFVAFRGRPPKTDALLRRYGLAA